MLMEQTLSYTEHVVQRGPYQAPAGLRPGYHGQFSPWGGGYALTRSCPPANLLEGRIEGLYHGQRPFHIEVSFVEPILFHTKFNAQPPAIPLAAYESARQSMMQFV